MGSAEEEVEGGGKRGEGGNPPPSHASAALATARRFPATANSASCCGTRAAGAAGGQPTGHGRTGTGGGEWLGFLWGVLARERGTVAGLGGVLSETQREVRGERKGKTLQEKE